MEITKDQVQHVAKLARLAITDDELATFGRQLSAILTHVETLNRVETAGVDATSHVIPMQNVFREDDVKSSLTQEAALANAPDQDGGCFRVPRIIE